MQRANLMLDLETLGTRPGCTILQIGAVFFGMDGVIGPTFSVNIHRESSEQYGFEENEETLQWWSHQGAAAKKLLTLCLDPATSHTVPVALAKFKAFVEEHSRGRAVVVWANSPAFDCTILRAYYDALGFKKDVPWQFYNERDYRTLKGISQVAADEWPEFEGVKHDALSDALHQARCAQVAFQALGLGRF